MDSSPTGEAMDDESLLLQPDIQLDVDVPGSHIQLQQDDLLFTVTSNPDCSVLIETNYDIVGCYMEDSRGELVNLFTEQEAAMEISTGEVQGSESFADVQNLNPENSEPDSEDSEMCLLLRELDKKYIHDSNVLECFPNNPIRMENSQFVEFEEQGEDRIGTTAWCSCSQCVPMQTNMESICCCEVENVSPHLEDRSCITEHHYFEFLCENKEIVSIIQRSVGDNERVMESNKKNRSLRKTAYRNFTSWIHGHLGKGNRRPIPSCVVNKIRTGFPDTLDRYMGYKPSSHYPAEFEALE